MENNRGLFPTGQAPFEINLDDEFKSEIHIPNDNTIDKTYSSFQKTSPKNTVYDTVTVDDASTSYYKHDVSNNIDEITKNTSYPEDNILDSSYIIDNSYHEDSILDNSYIADNSYPEDNILDNSYITDNSYLEDNILDNSYITDTSYPEDNISDNSYITNNSYPKDTLINTSHPENDIIDNTYTKDTFINNSNTKNNVSYDPYSTDSFINNSYPKNNVTDNSFSNDSFSNDSFVNNSYPKNNVTDNSFSNDSFLNDSFVNNTSTNSAKDILKSSHYDDITYSDASYNDINFDNEYNNTNIKKHKLSKKQIILISCLSFILLSLSSIAILAYKMLHGVQTDSKKADEKSIAVETKKGYKTIALLGSDASADRADTIIVASINEANGEIKMVSIARDMFAYVNGWEDYQVNDLNQKKGSVCDYTKINGSFCMNKDRTIPTPNRLVETINENLGLGIKDYLVVNFESVAQLVEAVGGIDVTLPDKDNFIWTMNRFGWEAAVDAGFEYTDVPEEARGKTVTLNGYQALGYCRVRKTAEHHPERPLIGESDFTRSERQKEVINKVFQKMKSGGISTILHVTDIFKDNKNFLTSFEMTDLISLAKDALTNSYHIIEDSENKISIPSDPHEVEMWKHKDINGKWIYTSTQYAKTNLYEDARMLHDYLYDNEQVDVNKYTKVMEISDQLEQYEQQYGLNGTYITKMCLENGTIIPANTKWPLDSTFNNNSTNQDTLNQTTQIQNTTNQNTIEQNTQPNY